MVAWGNKYRIQIQNFHPKILKIIQLIQDTLKITTIKFPDAHYCRNLSPVIYVHAYIPNIRVFSGCHVIGWIPIIKPINKDLIHHCTFGPCRRMITWVYFKLCPFFRVDRYSLIGVITCNPSIYNFKMISEYIFSHLDLCFIIIKAIEGRPYLHLLPHITINQIHCIHIISLGTKPYLYSVTRHWF